VEETLFNGRPGSVKKCHQLGRIKNHKNATRRSSGTSRSNNKPTATCDTTMRPAAARSEGATDHRSQERVCWVALVLRAWCTWTHQATKGWWLMADWCWFVLREKYCWLVAGGWFVLREKYC
jgi:uncharacterized MAPEG superfamily protein